MTQPQDGARMLETRQIVRQWEERGENPGPRTQPDTYPTIKNGKNEAAQED